MMDPEIKAEWCARIRACNGSSEKVFAEWLLNQLYMECNDEELTCPNRYDFKDPVSGEVVPFIRLNKYDQIHPKAAAWAGLAKTEPLLPSYTEMGGTRIRGRNQTLHAIQRVGEIKEVKRVGKSMKMETISTVITASYNVIAQLIEKDL